LAADVVWGLPVSDRRNRFGSFGDRKETRMKRQAAVLSAALAVAVAGIAVVSSNAQQPGPPTGTLVGWPTLYAPAESRYKRVRLER
jgi:hypothetical protein